MSNPFIIDVTETGDRRPGLPYPVTVLLTPEYIADLLRSRGYLVAEPGSAMAELVSAARHIDEGWYPDRCSELGELARKVTKEPTK